MRSAFAQSLPIPPGPGDLFATLLPDHFAADSLVRFYDEPRMLGCLNSLLYKIEILDKRGTPLSSDTREWREGSYPQAFLDARAYVADQMAKKERERLAA